MSVFGRASLQHHAVNQGLLSDMGGMHPRVSILGGQFRLVDEAGQPYGAPCVLRNTSQGQKLVMLAIIIGTNPKRSRIFYDQPYDPDNPAQPDCFSDNGIAPSIRASTPQARTCAECEWSKWGSDISALSGKKIKACSEKRKIALLVVGDTTQRVYEFQIPPATLKNMAKYAALVSQGTPPGEQRKADVCDLVTAVSFMGGQTGVLEFEPFGWISSCYRDEAGTIKVLTNERGEGVDAPDYGEAVGNLIDDIWSGEELPLLLGLNDTPWTPPAQLLAPLPGMAGAAQQPVQHALLGTAGGQVAPLAGTPAPPSTLFGGQPSPFAGSPFAAPENRQAATPALAFSSQAQVPEQPASGPADPPQAPRRRGRPPAQGNRATQGAVTAPGNVAPFQRPPTQPAGAAGGTLPDFLRRGRVSNDGSNPAGGPLNVASGPAIQPASGPAPVAATANTGSFGMVTADPPPSELAKTLGGVFSLPTARP